MGSLPPGAGLHLLPLTVRLPSGISLAYHMTGRKVKQNGKKAMDYLRKSVYDKSIKSTAPQMSGEKRRRGNEVQAK